MLFPDVHSAASLTVSPDRVQHFTSDSVSLTCEGNFTEWRVRKFSEDGRLSSDCRRMTGSTCNINTSKSDTAVYWCESGSGEFGSAVNITVQNDGNGPILVSPVHPVTEGASVSLSCSLRTQKILSNVFFYHNDKLIQNDTRGELKISAVSKSDEGFYKCQYSGRESAQSWMSVKGADSSSSPVWLIVGLVCGVSLIIILLLLLYRCRQSKCKSLFCITEFIYYTHFNYSHIYMYSNLMTQNKNGTIHITNMCNNICLFHRFLLHQVGKILFIITLNKHQLLLSLLCLFHILGRSSLRVTVRAPPQIMESTRMKLMNTTLFILVST
uniref:Ig-like domain-containing protein n=1 Tax=Oreochromis niloticus TaxID=8128 RepID=A0A669C0H2_ORENI